jgi:hypothetical protein
VSDTSRAPEQASISEQATEADYAKAMAASKVSWTDDVVARADAKNDLRSGPQPTGCKAEIAAAEGTIEEFAKRFGVTPGTVRTYRSMAKRWKRTRACRQLNRVWRATPHRKSRAAVFGVVSRGIPNHFFSDS